MAIGLPKLLIAVQTLVIFSAIGTGLIAAQVTFDGTANPNVTGPAPFDNGNYDIRAELGRQADHNLFHSFGTFSLRTGERATFSGPDEIRNIVSRVTGGARSDVDGTIASTIPGADFYFLNPAGVLFGPNARIDLKGSFHAASQLRAPCGARRDVGASSFTGVGRGGLPPSPDGPLASAYVGEAAVGEAEAHSRLTQGTTPAELRLAGLSAPCAPLD